MEGLMVGWGILDQFFDVERGIHIYKQKYQFYEWLVVRNLHIKLLWYYPIYIKYIESSTCLSDI